MNIVKRELKSNLRSMIIWSLALAFLVAIWMIEFESFASNPDINKFMESLPESMLNALGMGDLDIASLEGFISTISLYLYLILGIHAVLLGSSIISKEERDKTAEYLFSLPISRRKVVVGKTLAAIINILILNIITLITMIISTINYDKGEDFYRFIAIMFLATFILQLIFLSIGMFVSSVSKKYKKTGNVSVAILMITFLLASLINMVDSVDFLKYITPFKYFEATYIIREMSLEPVFIVISIIMIAIGIGGTIMLYPKRDLYI